MTIAAFFVSMCSGGLGLLLGSRLLYDGFTFGDTEQKLIGLIFIGFGLATLAAIL